MFRRTFFRCSFFLAPVFLALVGLVFTPIRVHAQDTNKWGRKYKTPPPSSRIEVTILKDDNGKPIENAAVIFHPIEGDRDKGALELKTNEDGKAVIDVIPIGDTVRLQVIANGFQTYGQDYKVDKTEMSMQVRMKRPVAQYSIYKDKNGSANSSGGSGGDKSAPPSKEATPPAQNDKGSSSNNEKNSDSANQNNSQPDQSQSQSK